MAEPAETKGLAVAVRRLLRLAPPLMVGLVFLVSAFSKGTDPVRFGRQIETLAGSVSLFKGSDLSSPAYILALLIVTLELAVGALLVSGCRRKIGAVGGSILLCIFIAVVIWDILHHSTADCGCFGPLLKRSGWEVLTEDAVLFALLLPSLVRAPQRPARKMALLCGGTVLVGIVWILLFTLLPPSWGALRAGMKWEGKTVAEQKYAVWLFDPDCYECQELLPQIARLADTGTPIIGLAPVTSGRLNEFRLDFTPTFRTDTITTEQFERWGVHKGTLLFINGGIISYIWGPGKIALLNH